MPARLDDGLKITDFTQEDAKTVCSWRYPPPYDIYHYPEWETARAQHYGMTDEETRRAEFYALKDGNNLTGFFRLTNHPDFVMWEGSWQSVDESHSNRSKGAISRAARLP